MAQLDYAHISDRGLKRQHNEDYSAVKIPDADTPEAAAGSLFLVADGIGSLGMGEVASQLATEIILEHYYGSHEKEATDRITAAVRAASQAVFERTADYDLAYMGTTVAGLILTPSSEAVVFNVGDSRVYRLRGGSMEQLTRDHATPSSETGKTKLTAFIGQAGPVPPTGKRVKVKKGDVFVICTDGLWGLIEEKEILKVVRNNPAETATQILLRMVHERGARDNVTIIVVRIGAFGKRSKFLPLLLVGLLIAAVGAGIYMVYSQEDKITVESVTSTEEVAFSISTLSPTPSDTPTVTPTLDARQTHTAESRATLNTQKTADAEAATLNAEETRQAQATSNAEATTDTVATFQAASTMDTFQTATVFARRTTTTAAIEISLSATYTQQVVIAATMVIEETSLAETATPVYTASIPVTPTVTLNSTLITYTPTLTPTVTLTPSMTPTLSSEQIFALAETGITLLTETMLYPNLNDRANAVLLPAQTRVQYAGEHENGRVKVIVLNGEETEGWIAETIFLEGEIVSAFAVVKIATAVRSGDGRSFGAVAQLEAGTTIPVLGRSPTGPHWYLILLPDGHTGWVAPGVVTIVGDEAQIPSVQSVP